MSRAPLRRRRLPALAVLTLAAIAFGAVAPARAAEGRSGARSIAVVGAADTAYRGPALLVPSAPDSAPPESAPAPLLIPGRPNPPDSTTLSLADRARAAYQLGLRLEAGGAPGPAIVSYRNAVRFDPTLPDANHRMAMLFLTRDQIGEAIKCLLGELAHHPENVESDRQLGLCFARLGDSTRAMRHLERLARQHPSDGAVWHALGSVYLSSRRPHEAEVALRKALRFDPTTAEELRDMGATLATLGRPSEARIYYRRALQIEPSDAASWLNLGNLERSASHPDSALAFYRRAEAADSGFVPALEAQLQLLRVGARDGEAVEVYRRWLHQHPDHHGTRMEAVRLLEDLGRDDEALALAREGAERPRADGQSHVLLGMVLRGRGDTRGALAALRKAEALFAGNAGERERVVRTIAAIRASAPDSLRPLIVADSLAAERRRRR